MSRAPRPYTPRIVPARSTTAIPIGLSAIDCAAAVTTALTSSGDNGAVTGPPRGTFCDATRTDPIASTMAAPTAAAIPTISWDGNHVSVRMDRRGSVTRGYTEVAERVSSTRHHLRP